MERGICLTEEINNMENDYINRQQAIDELVRWGKIPDYNDAEKMLLGVLLECSPPCHPHSLNRIRGIG